MIWPFSKSFDPSSSNFPTLVYARSFTRLLLHITRRHFQVATGSTPKRAKKFPAVDTVSWRFWSLPICITLWEIMTRLSASFGADVDGFKDAWRRSCGSHAKTIENTMRRIGGREAGVSASWPQENIH